MLADGTMTLPPQAASDELLAPPATPPADARLIADCLGGDMRAFDEIVRTHTPRVFNYVLHMTRHRQDAEDIAQQTFIKAYTHLSSFDPTRSFIAWLLTIARRTALNHFRSAKNFEQVDDTHASTETAPDNHVEKRDQLDTLWAQAKRTLSEREYEVLWLRYAEDMSLEETAKIVGLTQTHTKIIAFRARQRLIKLQSPSS
ncbi:MAG: sigma-70 family RNA polymerase sigma factor [Nibricoccus sp.]